MFNSADISQYNSPAHIESVRTYLKNADIKLHDDHQPGDLLNLVLCVQGLNSCLKCLDYSNDTDDAEMSNAHTLNTLTDSLIFNDKK